MKMKLSLIALATLSAIAGTASAQSSVTIYGLVDLGVAKSNGGTAANEGAPTSKAWTVRDSYANRLGLRGKEDLGSGMSAEFNIEHRFRLETGAITNANSFWHGRSIVQLNSGMGSVYMGRDYIPAFWPVLWTDPFVWSGVGQIGQKSFAGFTAPNYGQGAGIRTSNTVGYKSPSIAGLTANVAVGLSGSTGAGRETGFNLEYRTGPLYAGIGSESISKGPLDGNSLTTVGAAYDLGYVKPMLTYSRAEVAGRTNKFFSIGATAPLGGGRVKAAYYRFDPAGINNVQTKLGLGYDHLMSKRTTLYADLGLGREDARSNNSAWMIGVRHTF